MLTGEVGEGWGGGGSERFHVRTKIETVHTVGEEKACQICFKRFYDAH